MRMRLLIPILKTSKLKSLNHNFPSQEILLCLESYYSTSPSNLSIFEVSYKMMFDSKQTFYLLKHLQRVGYDP